MTTPTPRIRLLIGDTIAIGPGKASLLERIDNTGSISAAAREMGMSYRKAWRLIDSINDDFNAEIVSKSTGGKGGGGEGGLVAQLAVPLAYLRARLAHFATVRPLSLGRAAGSL